MRWLKKATYETGCLRTITKFAFLPICINNEVRWLETVKITQLYEWQTINGYKFHAWRNINFGDPEDN